MKKIIFLFLVGAITISGIQTAYASFWADDDFNQAGMDTSKWGVQGGADQNLILEERGDGRLSAYTLAPISTHTERQYFSTWSFTTLNDFQYQTDFYFNHTGEGYASLLMGVTSTSYNPTISVFGGSEGGGSTSFHSQYFKYIAGVSSTIGNGVNHNYNRGRFTAMYDADDKSLQFTMVPLDSEGNIISGVSYTNIVTTDLTQYGDNWRVMLAGSAEGNAQLAYGEAYFEDFRVLDNTVVPEPSSLLLLGFGGIITALIKKRRKA